VIVSADGSLAAEIPFQDGVEVGHRLSVRYSQIPQLMVQAVLAAEDIRFFTHQGVDAHAVARAAWSNYKAGHVVEGASTITQQVARNLLRQEIGNERSIRRKVREALLARRIEKVYPKQRIFETYINHVFLGGGAYGISAAARGYFDKRLDELSVAQTAMIAGLAQAPGRADPFKAPAVTKARRDEVLGRMLRAEMITNEEHEQARATPIELTPPTVRYGTIAPWHTARARGEIETLAPAHYMRGGLRIETSASVTVSADAVQIARDFSERLGKGRENGAPQIGALIWDYRTGYLEATVGGLDWKDSQFDRSTQACRQPGSAFKPLVYAAALERNAITPGTALRDAPIAVWDDRMGVHWKPTNSGRSFRGVALAQDALASSLNAPAVDVLDRVGAKAVVALAKRLGVTTRITEVRPMALGSSCMIPIELAGAFATFAAGGHSIEPVFVVRVTRGDEVLLDRASIYDPNLTASRRLDRLADLAANAAIAEPVLDRETAYQVSSMLRDVVLRGTGTPARSIGRPAAGKTGTTNENTDAWFVGYTARIVTAVWVGHDDPAKRLGKRDDGSHAALPVWKRLVKLAEASRTAVEVPGEAPDSMVRRRVDRETGLLAQPRAGGALDLFFKRGTEPTQSAGTLQGVPVDLGRATRRF
jgi:penicillin-binding protein 1A